MDFLTYVKKHQKPIVEELRALVGIPSVFESFDPQSDTPFGVAIDEALRHMLALGEKDGFGTKNVKGYAGHIEFGEGEEVVGILGHLDVVPDSTGWTHPPFNAEVKNGKIYGRGTMDDKGPVIAAYFAMKFLKDLDVSCKKRVRLILGTDEETSWRGIREYFKQEKMPDYGFSPDATFPLIHGEKGILNFDFHGPHHESPLRHFFSGHRYNMVPDYAECTLSEDLSKQFKAYLKYHDYKGSYSQGVYRVQGRSSHGMSPYHGLNAAFILANFLYEHIDDPYIAFIHDKLAFDPYGEKLGIAMKEPVLSSLTINPGIFRYDQENGGRIAVTLRYPLHFNARATALKLKNAARHYGFDYERKMHLPLHHVSVESPLVEKLMAAYQKVTNDHESRPYTIGGGTYARALEHGVAFGLLMPGREEEAHRIDEHVHIEDLLEGTAIYMEAIYNLTRKAKGL